MKISSLVLALSFTPVAAQAGPKEDTGILLDRFISIFNEARDLESMTRLFSENAQFWGTRSPELGTSVQPIRVYFEESFAGRAKAPTQARIVSVDVRSISPDTVLAAGRWELARPNGSVTPLRFSAVVQKSSEEWKFVQFHSSPRPEK